MADRGGGLGSTHGKGVQKWVIGHRKFSALATDSRFDKLYSSYNGSIIKIVKKLN